MMSKSLISAVMFLGFAFQAQAHIQDDCPDDALAHRYNLGCMHEPAQAPATNPVQSKKCGDFAVFLPEPAVYKITYKGRQLDVENITVSQKGLLPISVELATALTIEEPTREFDTIGFTFTADHSVVDNATNTVLAKCSR